MTCSQDSNVTMKACQGAAKDHLGPPVLTKPEPTLLFAVPAEGYHLPETDGGPPVSGTPPSHSSSHVLTLQVPNSTSFYS